jgi:hypothetical protein
MTDEDEVLLTVPFSSFAEGHLPTLNEEVFVRVDGGAKLSRMVVYKVDYKKGLVRMRSRAGD